MTLDDPEDVLRRPGGAELYKELQREAWLSPFLECNSRVFQRLGAALLVEELLVRLDPERAEAERQALYIESRRDVRLAERKRRQRIGQNATTDLRFFYDETRHLVCVPYSVKNLHRMARALDINRCQYHARATYAWYDIPKRRFAEIAARCTKVRPREILAICKGADMQSLLCPVPILQACRTRTPTSEKNERVKQSGAER